MFDSLSQRLARIVKTMRGEARLTEANTQEMLREIRIALLEADVALPVVRDFIAQVKEKALGGMSIGYREILIEQDHDEKVTNLLELDLWEVSVVTFPANEEATVDSVKSALAGGGLPTLPEFEKFLRDAGFSKSQSVAIASHCLRQLLRDADDTEAKEIESALNILKGSK